MQLLSKTKKGLVAILQVRSAWNSEKNAPESWPEACQVTVHGKLEEGEDFIQAIFREISEELGPEIVPFIRELFANGKFKELIDLETPEGHIVTYGGIVTEKVCKVLLAKQKDRSFGGFKIIRSNEINKIIDLQTINKDTGVTDEETIAMFRDEKEAVRLAFLKLG